MSLYRKYRPSTFGEVIGQGSVVDVLARAIKDKTIAHAYLFAGSRGTGKTSVARILAKDIGTAPEDLYEIDAASNRGIDEIRELREAVRTLPFNSKYKVYIIDEGHMLTAPAFNALLKTLEEPPAHVIFILATTEAHKLPETIVSRCQVFNFKKPTEEEVKQLVLHVAKSEGYKIDAGSLSLVALLSEGAFRDALTVLEKVINTSKDKKISLDEVEEVTGAPRVALLEQFVKALAEADRATALAVLAGLGDKNIDARVFAKLVMRDIRYAMLISFAPELIERIKNELASGEFEFVQSLGKHPGVKKFPNVLREFLAAYSELGRSHIPTLPLELAVVRLLPDEVSTI